MIISAFCTVPALNLRRPVDRVSPFCPISMSLAFSDEDLSYRYVDMSNMSTTEERKKTFTEEGSTDKKTLC